MPRFLKYLFPVLAVLAVAGAQVCGIRQGFECDHQDRVVRTEAEHCHRGAGTKPDFTPCAEEHQDNSNHRNDTEHHAPMSVEMNASTAALAVVSVPSFVAVLVTDVPTFEGVLVKILPENQILKMPLDTGGESPPASLQVARCMVILV